MDELTQVRSELARLEKEERDLHEQLSSVRVAIEAHKSRIDDLIRTKPAPISSLPSEILSYVLELAAFPFRDYRIRELARVSRAWRDIILSFPNFWSNIELHDSCANMSLLKAHVARSCQYPLCITIGSWRTPAELSSFLDVIVPHVYRWRTLDIYSNCMQVILDKINHLKFPSLTHTTIISDGNMQYPVFLWPENAPSLKRLDLGLLIPMDDFPPGQRIADLRLRFSDGRFGPMVLPSLLSSRDLTTLNFTCSDCPLLQPNSISLPFLTSLILSVRHPRGLMSAIVAPQLLYLHFADIFPSHGLSTAFHGFESKFPHVQHLVLQAPTVYSRAAGAEDVRSLFGTNMDGLRPADHWESLKSLTLSQMTIYYESSIIKDLVQWLEQRKLAGRPMLNLIFFGCDFRFDCVDEGEDEDEDEDEDERALDPSPLLAFHNLLKGICLLDITSTSVKTWVNLSISSSSPSQLVCIAVIVKPVTLLTSNILEITTVTTPSPKSSGTENVQDRERSPLTYSEPRCFDVLTGFIRLICVRRPTYIYARVCYDNPAFETLQISK